MREIPTSALPKQPKNCWIDINGSKAEIIVWTGETGKKLSPRKIMMDVRDRAEEVGKSLDNKKSTNTKSLFSDYISKEEIFACTSCNACVEACPININPLEVILELRRFSALEESSSPSEWNDMFQNIETNYSPWKFPIDDRFNWSKE